MMCWHLRGGARGSIGELLNRHASQDPDGFEMGQHERTIAYSPESCKRRGYKFKSNAQQQTRCTLANIENRRNAKHDSTR